MRVRLLSVIAYAFFNNSAPGALSAAASPNLAQDKAIETAIELFRVSPDKIRRALMESNSTLHPASFAPISREDLPLNDSERRRGIVAKLRFRFEKSNTSRAGYYFYLIYRDQAAARKGGDDDPDAVPYINKVTLNRTDRGSIEINCQPWSPPSTIGARCWRVEPSLPVVVVGAIEERQNTKTQKLEKSFVDPASLLNTAIDLLHREVK